jgi:transposase-like protein
VLSLTARGLTTGEIAAHVAEVYGAKVSKYTIEDHRQRARVFVPGAEVLSSEPGTG